MKSLLHAKQMNYVYQLGDYFCSGGRFHNDKEALNYALALADMRKTIVLCLQNLTTKKFIIKDF